MSRLPALPQRPTRGIDPNTPEEGMWLFRWVKNGPPLPARIIRIHHEPGSENDPDGPNALDRGPVWTALVGGKSVDPLRVWTGRRERVLTEQEYEFQLARCAWIRDYAPHEPEAQPRKPVDLRSLPPIGPKE